MSTTKRIKSGDKSAPATLEVSSAKAIDPTRAVGEGVSAVYVRLDDLRPNPRNPRVHGPEKLNLARTILRTTWGAPIIAQRSTMRIIGGHGRLEAAREIMAGVEVDGFLRGGAEHRFTDDAPGPGMVPCRLVDCNDATADAMTLADNSRRLQGRDDPTALVAMASHAFTRDAPTMLDMGFGGADLDALVKQGGDAMLASALDFKPGTADDQSKLDEKMRETITCPECAHEFQR
jgi:hypothetical protein